MNVRNCFHFKTFLLFCKKKNKSRCCVLGGGKPFHLACSMFMIMYLLKEKGEVASLHMSSGYLVHEELK